MVEQVVIAFKIPKSVYDKLNRVFNEKVNILAKYFFWRELRLDTSPTMKARFKEIEKKLG